MTTLVELLTEASGHDPLDPAEHQLAIDAQKWLTLQGWDYHYNRGFEYRGIAFTSDPDERAIVLRRKRGSFWEAEGRPHYVYDFGGALNTLVILNLVHAQFSTFGRDALMRHAKVCRDVASALDAKALGEHTEHGKRLALKADGWREAADGAAGTHLRAVV